MERGENAARLREVLAQLNAYGGMVEALIRQLSGLSGVVSELLVTVEAMRTLRDIKPGTEVLVPLGQDSFVRAELKPGGKILIGVGADVVVERTVEEGIEMLEARAKELEEVMGRTEEDIRKLEERIGNLRREAQRLAARGREESERGKP